MEKCTLTFLGKQWLRNQAQTTAKRTVSGKSLGSSDGGSGRKVGQSLANSGGLDPGKVSVLLSRKFPKPHTSTQADERTGSHGPRESRQWRQPAGVLRAPYSRPAKPGKELLRASLGGLPHFHIPSLPVSRADHTQTPSLCWEGSTIKLIMHFYT